METNPSKELFFQSLEYSIRTAAAKGKTILSQNLDAPTGSMTEYEGKIRTMAPKYRDSVKAIKEIDEIKKVLPPKKYSILDMAVRDAKDTVKKVEGYKNVLHLAKTQVKEAKDNLAHLDVSLKEKDSEFASINKLIKNKFIEKMEFLGEGGLQWTYPPMVYNETSIKRTLFLGRPEITLSNSTTFGMQVRFPSYKRKDERVGTIHAYNDDVGDKYCLGGYENIVFVLCAKYQISNLIRLMYEYLGSCNVKSRYCTPSPNIMSISGPEVSDDSYEVWKKSDPKLAAMLAENESHLPEIPEDVDEEEEENP